MGYRKWRRRLDIYQDHLGNIYLSGYGLNEPPDSNTDTFLIKYSDSGELIWENRWGGNKYEHSGPIAGNASGYLYVTGATLSYGAGNQDVNIMKYAYNGTKMWNKTWGGSNYESGRDIVLGSNGYFYVTGFSSTGTLLLKYDVDGNLKWSRAYTEIGGARGCGIELDSEGNIYVCGYVDTQVSPLETDVLILKYNSSGDLEWFRHWAKNTYEAANKILIDENDDLYLCGFTGTYAPTVTDALILKYDKDGNEIWNKTWGKQDSNGVNLDKLGDKLFVVGQENNYGNGGYDAFMLELNATTGNIMDFSNWGGSEDETFSSVIVVDENKKYVCGRTSSYGCGDMDAIIGCFNSSTDELGIPSNYYSYRGLPERLYNCFLLNEDFSTDVLAAGNWTATNDGTSTSVDTNNGELEMQGTRQLSPGYVNVKYNFNLSYYNLSNAQIVAQWKTDFVTASGLVKWQYQIDGGTWQDFSGTSRTNDVEETITFDFTECNLDGTEDSLYIRIYAELEKMLFGDEDWVYLRSIKIQKFQSTITDNGPIDSVKNATINVDFSRFTNSSGIDNETESNYRVYYAIDDSDINETDSQASRVGGFNGDDAEFNYTIQYSSFSFPGVIYYRFAVIDGNGLYTYWSQTFNISINLYLPTLLSISINSGEASTNSTLVSLSLSAVGADEMCFKNGTFGSWTGWEPYSIIKQLYLIGSTNNTEYTIYVKFKNSTGETEEIYDSIIFLVGEDTKSFNPLKDGFSFINPGWTSACFGLMSYDEAKSILTNDKWHSHLKDKTFFPQLCYFIYLFAKSTHTEGHCYGMCSLLLKYYNDQLSTPGGVDPYDLSLSQVVSDVEYFHNTQLLNYMIKAITGSWGEKYSPINDNNQWEIIRNSINNGIPLIIGLHSENGDHGVIGYGINGDGDVLIYDPTFPATASEPTRVIELRSNNRPYYAWKVYNEKDIDINEFRSWVALTYDQPKVFEWFYDLVENDSLMVKAECPLELSIIDENGVELNKTVSDGETHMALILNATNHHYRIKLNGTGNGNYTLKISRIHNEIIYNQTIKGIISKGQIMEYYISVEDDNFILQLIENPLSIIIMWSLIIGIVALLGVAIIIIRKKKKRKKLEYNNKKEEKTDQSSLIL